LRRAYSRFRHELTARELHGVFTPVQEELQFGRTPVRIDDLMAHKERIDTAYADVLAQLTADAQENDLSYSR